MIGISIDSLDRNTNLAIGRNQGSHTLDYDQLEEILFYIKSKGIVLKVNSVISKLNLEEDITKLYNEIGFARIKLLQVRIQDNCNEMAKPTEIGSKEFDDYVAKIFNKTHGSIIIESTDAIESSYVIIDPEGFLISNFNQTYTRIGNILHEPLQKLIDKARLDINKFNQRYDTVSKHD
jgi:radical S-adenosyl methionine domain-containing protein 2